MILDTTILDEYIRTKSSEKISKHWIFDKIVEGKHMFEVPPEVHYNKIIILRSLITKKLKNFEPNNKAEWVEIFGKQLNSTDEQIVMLIVGAPNPYDAFVRKDHSGNDVMVFDIERLIDYDNVADVINGIVTHEVAHTLIHKDHNLYHGHLHNDELLKQMLFDEGFAHYVSFTKFDELNNNREQYNQYKNNVYGQLKTVLTREITDQDLVAGNSGKYWNKYISISGLFTIIDYLNNGGVLADLYKKGYNHFYDYWLSVS